MMSALAPLFRTDPLSFFIGAFVLFFFLLTLLYSSGSMRGREGLARYYAYLVATLAASWGAVFANHLIVFLVFWGFLAFLLYLLIGFGQKSGTPATAKKALLIVGGSDALMLLGLALIWRLTGSLRMDQTPIAFTSRSASASSDCVENARTSSSVRVPYGARPLSPR